MFVAGRRARPEQVATAVRTGCDAPVHPGSPFRRVQPILGALAVAAIDVEAHPAAPARHAVLSLPTLILFRDGAEAERLTGSPSEKKIRKALEKHLS